MGPLDDRSVAGTASLDAAGLNDITRSAVWSPPLGPPLPSAPRRSTRAVADNRVVRCIGSLEETRDGPLVAEPAKNGARSRPLDGTELPPGNPRFGAEPERGEGISGRNFVIEYPEQLAQTTSGGMLSGEEEIPPRRRLRLCVDTEAIEAALAARCAAEAILGGATGDVLRGTLP